MSAKTFLAVDFGASTLKVAEFDITAEGTLALRNYGMRSLGLAGSNESARQGLLIKALQEMIGEKGFASKEANVCAPGFNVFSKFVKLPPVDSGKVTQIIQYEAQQNIPFPLEEVVWDYQIMGTSSSGELEVLIVAIKSDLVEGLFKIADDSGLKLQLVDVSPAAMANSFRFNYPELDGCTMLLDIGAKTSNVLFFEGDKVYARSINIGANSITQEFAAEAKMPFVKAEEIKINDGFVSLGGAYEEPENQHQAAISKIARQVMTRLHIQVNQTIQFYRQQQGGSAPVRVFLAGGASIMPYTAQFFSEKLNIPVEYFNPMRNIQFDESIDLEELAKVAHSYGEVVGLALRNLAQCPVEMNLVPKGLLQRQQINQKKPYLIASIFSLVLVVFAVGLLYSKLYEVKAEALADLQEIVEPMDLKDRRFRKVLDDRQKIETGLVQLNEWRKDRIYWLEVFNELRSILQESEQQFQADFGVPVGLWIEKLVTVDPIHSDEGKRKLMEESKDDQGPAWANDLVFLERYGLLDDPRYAAAKKKASAGFGESVDLVIEVNDTNSISSISMVIRAVDIEEESGDSTANDTMMYGLVEAMRKSPMFSSNKTETVLADKYKKDEGTDTVTFPLNIVLSEPMKL